MLNPSVGVLRAAIAVVALACSSNAMAGELAFRTQEIGAGLTVGYAVSVVDMNNDHKPDIVVVDTQRVIWYENPTWRLHTVIEGATKKDNVCIAPYDIDGDGRLDFALGADWRPFDTRMGGTVQWVERPPQAEAEGAVAGPPDRRRTDDASHAMGRSRWRTAALS